MLSINLTDGMAARTLKLKIVDQCLFLVDGETHGRFPDRTSPCRCPRQISHFLFAACKGGAGKLSSFVELCDSVDLRFFDRVGAIIVCIKHSGITDDSECWLK